MINELTSRLTAIGLSEEMANKAIETVADFAKSKLPEQFHGALDDVMAGNTPDLGGLGGLGGLLGGLKGLFGGK
jgi:hypothetical protein